MSNDSLRIFILEDDPFRCDWFRKIFSDCQISIEESVEGACQKIRSEQYDLIFLDRDISHPTESGEDVAWTMKIEKLAQTATIVIHTVNPHGQRAMKRYLESYHPSVYVIPFPELMKKNREDFQVS